jgi:hypothetical protein
MRSCPRLERLARKPGSQQIVVLSRRAPPVASVPAVTLADLPFTSGDLRSALGAQASKLVAELQAAPEDQV